MPTSGAAPCDGESCISQTRKPISPGTRQSANSAAATNRDEAMYHSRWGYLRWFTMALSWLDGAVARRWAGACLQEGDILPGRETECQSKITSGEPGQGRFLDDGSGEGERHFWPDIDPKRMGRNLNPNRTCQTCFPRPNGSSAVLFSVAGSVNP